MKLIEAVREKHKEDLAYMIEHNPLGFLVIHKPKFQKNAQIQGVFTRMRAVFDEDGGSVCSKIFEAENGDDAVGLFWLLRDMKKLKEKCGVVMAGYGTHHAWPQLTTVYLGSQFGNMFTMTYTEKTRVGILPCQLGLYNT